MPRSVPFEARRYRVRVALRCPHCDKLTARLTLPVAYPGPLLPLETISAISTIDTCQRGCYTGRHVVWLPKEYGSTEYVTIEIG